MEIVEKELANKLKALYLVNNNAPSVTIMILAKVGSRYENSEERGIAHFVEHTFFKGTERRPTSKHIGMDIELMGGNSNAFTSYEYTGYYITVPKVNFEGALEILFDMICHALFAQEEIEKEAGVILEEIRMYEDIPNENIKRNFNSQLFLNHPLGEDIAGTEETILKLKRQDFLKFVEKNYIGENLLVSIAGDIRPEKAHSLLKSYFEILPQGKRLEFVKSEKRKLAGEKIFVPKKTEQTHLIMGGFGYHREYPQRYALRVGNAILSYGLGSRLFQVIREKLGLAYYVYSSVTEFSELGKFTISMGVDNKKVNVALEATLKELQEIKRGNFTELELDRAKNYLMGNIITQLESTEDIAQWYGLQRLLLGKIVGIDEIIKKISSVSKEDVVETWSNILHRENMQFAALGPHEKFPEFAEDIL